MHELIQQFGVDWKLLLAQVVNFLLLMYLLRRFAYTPLLNVLRERREKIDAGLKAAKASEERLAEADETRKKIILKAEEDAVETVTHAEETAKKNVNNLLAAAREEHDRIIASGAKKLEEEKRLRESEVRERAEELIKKGLRATIGRMNPTERDEALIKESLRELASLK